VSARPLEGRRALVTGASSGIGAAVVERLQAAGAIVAGGARRVDDVRADVPLELDVQDPVACAAFVTEAVRRLGGLDIVVSNAGIGAGARPAWEDDEETVRRIVATNLEGAMRIARLAVPHIGTGGNVVFIGSVAAHHAYPGAAAYITTKYGLRGFTHALRHDLLGQRIGVTTVDPGLVESPFWETRFAGDSERANAYFAGTDALTPADVADCVAFAVARPPHVAIEEIVVMPIDHTGTRTA
jgi:NADP-dependent 3-hydroxy acid dehydrogenase YdfG